MECRISKGPPEPGSEREKSFNDGKEYIRGKALKIVKDRENGVDTNEIPFIDALLQSHVPEEQVII